MLQQQLSLLFFPNVFRIFEEATCLWNLFRWTPKNWLWLEIALGDGMAEGLWGGGGGSDTKGMPVSLSRLPRALHGREHQRCPLRREDQVSTFQARSRASPWARSLFWVFCASTFATCYSRPSRSFFPQQAFWRALARASSRWNRRRAAGCGSVSSAAESQGPAPSQEAQTTDVLLPEGPGDDEDLQAGGSERAPVTVSSHSGPWAARSAHGAGTGCPVPVTPSGTRTAWLNPGKASPPAALYMKSMTSV